jgi:Ni/Co efflux regulator RcnB
MLRLLTTVVALSLAAAVPAFADNDKTKGKGNGNPGKPNDGITAEEIVQGVTAGVLGAVLSDDERRIIHRYFGEHPDSVGKVKELPPGIRKKLARGGAMPPGIAKQALPDGLHRQLPPRDGQHYEIIGTDVVLVETATRIIVDVLKGVLRGG